MYELNPDRLELAREFLAKPYGTHSPELAAALNRLRLANPGGKMILVCTERDREWMLARLEGEPPLAVPVPGMVFRDLEEAERAVLRLRWKSLTGVELEVEVDRSSPAPRPE